MVKFDFRRLRGVIKVLLFLVITFFLLTLFTKIFQRKESMIKYKPFYEAEENFDVLFFGTSHGANGFAPMELWDSHGIASYNMSQHSEYMPVTYYQVLNALEYTNPKLIVIDPYLIAAPDKIPGDRQTWSYIHDSLDAMPFSSIKWAAINDFFPKFNDKLEFLWNFTMYHNRWNELSENDYTRNYNIEKGSESRIGNMRLAPLSTISKEEAADLTGTIGLTYLDKIIDECNRRGIEVLLVYLPYQADVASQMSANGLERYALEKGVHYTNLLYDSPINYSTDLYDAGHLNPSGYKKVANYLGSYIQSNYEVPDRRNDTTYSHWYEDYEVYAKMQMDAILDVDDFYVYLSLLNNKNLSFTISINGASSFLANDYVDPYLYNLGITSDLKQISDSSQNFFAIIDGSEQTVTEYIDQTHIEAYPSFGAVKYDCDEFGVQTFEVGTEIYQGTMAENYIRITVINNRTGQVLDNITFYENMHYEFLRYED